MPKGIITVQQNENNAKNGGEKKNQFKHKTKPIQKSKLELIQQRSIKKIVEKQLKSEQLPDEYGQKQLLIQKDSKQSNRPSHLAVCFPDSILQLPQTSLIRAYFISQLARIVSIFKVDQIVILKDHSYVPKSQNFKPWQYLARNFQYVETPQYLRKQLFKMHPDLQNAGSMNPIESFHHLRSDQKCQFRQGVTLERPVKKGSGSWVDIGLKQQAKLNLALLPLTRVTVRLKNYQQDSPPFYEAEAVSKRTPYEQKNLYWGYDVRIAQNLKMLLTNKQEKLYDYCILCNKQQKLENVKQLTSFNSLDLKGKKVILVYSGNEDIRSMIRNDPKSKLTEADLEQLFDFYFKFPTTGVKQLRIEQQLFMSLAKVGLN